MDTRKYTDYEARQAALVKEWNEKQPIGTAVIVHFDCGDSEQTTTLSEAYMFQDPNYPPGREAAIQLKHVPGPYPLMLIEPHMVQDELEKEAPVRNKYEVVFLQLLGRSSDNPPESEVVEMQEGDIPIGYRSRPLQGDYCEPGAPVTGKVTYLVREVIILRPAESA
jgi:hypothetical protein